MKKSVIRGTIRAVVFFLWTLLLVPPYLLLFVLGKMVRRPFVKLWHTGVCFIIGMKVTRYGTPSKSQNLLLAGNHISYLDIPILASLFDITFVAKADVADWPLFGFLAKIAQTAFIERKPSKARQQTIDLQKRIQKSEKLMIFPEGTSSEGEKVLDFKSSLFEMVMEDHMRETTRIQPVTIAYCRTKKKKALTRNERDNFAWYGDMTLAPHLWEVFCLDGVEVDVVFHAPALANDFKSRKELSAWAHSRVQAGLNNLQNVEVYSLAEDERVENVEDDQIQPLTL